MKNLPSLLTNKILFCSFALFAGDLKCLVSIILMSLCINIDRNISKGMQIMDFLNLLTNYFFSCFYQSDWDGSIILYPINQRLLYIQIILTTNVRIQTFCVKLLTKHTLSKDLRNTFESKLMI